MSINNLVVFKQHPKVTYSSPIAAKQMLQETEKYDFMEKQTR